jgi:hypothetical protein
MVHKSFLHIVSDEFYVRNLYPHVSHAPLIGFCPDVAHSIPYNVVYNKRCFPQLCYNIPNYPEGSMMYYTPCEYSFIDKRYGAVSGVAVPAVLHR